MIYTHQLTSSNDVLSVHSLPTPEQLLFKNVVLKSLSCCAGNLPRTGGREEGMRYKK